MQTRSMRKAISKEKTWQKSSDIYKDSFTIKNMNSQYSKKAGFQIKKLENRALLDLKQGRSIVLRERVKTRS